jgi:KDO2-lipid IV(A) lauroyltransferase
MTLVKADRSAKREPVIVGPGLAERMLIIAPLSGLYNLILRLVRRFDDASAVKVVYLLIWPVLLLFRGQRAINLRRLFMPLGRTREQCNEISRQYVWNHAQLILEAVRLSDMTPEQVRHMVTFDGEEHLTRALKKGRGALLIGNHIGNWLFSVAFLSARGYKVSAVAYEIPIKSIEAHMKSLWRRYHLSITSVGRGAPAAARQAFKKNEVFVALTDVSLRPMHGQWLRLGAAAINVDTGPAKLALLTGAPLLHLSNHREPDSRFAVSISPEIDRGSIGNDPACLAQFWLNELHKELLLWPEQWWLLTLTPLRLPADVPLPPATTSSLSSASQASWHGQTTP